MDKRKRFDRICKDIKSLKIQGAKAVAKAGLMAYSLFPDARSKKKILSLRPTEAMLINVLKMEGIGYGGFLDMLKKTQSLINEGVFKLLKGKKVVFTHCHSSSVVEALIYSKKKGRKFEVYNTETRPRYQGLKTARELSKAGIKVSMFVDSGAGVALEDRKKVGLVLLGADVISKEGTLNKIGSGMFAEIAKINKIPVYIVSDSMKYLNKRVRIEERDAEEVWKTKLKIHIENPAFELIDRDLIKGVVSEFGVLSYGKFIRRARKR